MILKNNINKIFAINGIRWFMLLMPIIVLFFEESGLNLTQILILPAIYSFTIALLEIPFWFFFRLIWKKKLNYSKYNILLIRLFIIFFFI